MERNPKQAGTNLFDCVPQAGPCPNNCNQCFYNRPGAFYLPIDVPQMPIRDEVGDGILRVNSGHDSNINRDHVIAITNHFPKRFFNTSVPKFDFPAPVVYTANPREEEPAKRPMDIHLYTNIMFIRLRVSATNLIDILDAAYEWSVADVPVVLTFMRYYDYPPNNQFCYEYRKSIWPSRSWAPTREFMAGVMRVAQKLTTLAPITMCGTLDSGYCRDCLNCEKFYQRMMQRGYKTCN
jgi:hypothetical protein